jgi:hypothetical protein
MTQVEDSDEPKMHGIAVAVSVPVLAGPTLLRRLPKGDVRRRGLQQDETLLAEASIVGPPRSEDTELEEQFGGIETTYQVAVRRRGEMRNRRLARHDPASPFHASLPLSSTGDEL